MGPKLKFRMLQLSVLALLTIGGVWAASPAPHTRSNSAGSLPRADCSSEVGFSAVGLKQVHNTRLVSYAKSLFSNGIAFNKDTGDATVLCPGLYHITFAGYGDSPDTKVVLKTRVGTNNDWEPVVYAGGQRSGGGSNQVLLTLQRGDQVAMYVAAGDLAEGPPRQRMPSTSFSAFKLTKN